jgi:hypothetical protein
MKSCERYCTLAAGFGTNYYNLFISGLEEFLAGIEKSDNEKMLLGQLLLYKWGDWYSENLEKLKGKL